MYKVLVTLRPVLALVGFLAALHTPVVEQAKDRVVQDALAHHCCAAPADSHGFEELTASLNQLDAVIRRVGDLAELDLPRR